MDCLRRGGSAHLGAGAWPSSQRIQVLSHTLSTPSPRLGKPCCARAQTRLEGGPPPDLAPFPDDFPQAIQLAQVSTLQALSDGIKLIEVEFPSASLLAVAGDAEGANEMTYSSRHLRQFCRAFHDGAAKTRIFFPDKEELRVAKQGKGMDPNAGAWDIDPIWDQTAFSLDYLTEPSGLLDLGINLNRFDPSARLQPSDELIIAAYPHFDPREMEAVHMVWQNAAKQRGIPMILFNAELDRLRGGYYPALFYPQMAKLSKEFIPLVESTFYLHNFKGSGGGALFRVYPGPWQVLLRTAVGMKAVHTQDERPTLRQVALDILPAIRAMR
jgi:hypothetical protein